MNTTLEHTARRIAERGHDALIERLRPAFAQAAARHADVLLLDPDQLEEMIQRAAERADGLQWRRALASVAVEELGITLSEALTHPAVARAQTIIGAPSYEESVAKLAPASATGPSGVSATAGGAFSAGAGSVPASPAPTPVAPGTTTTPGTAVTPGTAATPATPATPGTAGTPATPPPAAAPATAALVAGAPQPQAPAPAQTTSPVGSSTGPDLPRAGVGAAEGIDDAGHFPQPVVAEPETQTDTEGAGAGVVVLAAIHVGGVASLTPTESEIELRIADDGLQLVRSGQVFERLSWAQIRGVEIHDSRRLRRRGHGAQLLLRSERGEATFEIRDVASKELRERLGPLLARR